MKRKIMIMISLLLLLTLTMLSFAATYTLSERVHGSTFRWGGSCSANFDTTTGKFLSHGPMYNIYKPSNTGAYSYSVWREIRGSGSYYADQAAIGEKTIMSTGGTIREEIPVRIQSQGAMKIEE